MAKHQGHYCKVCGEYRANEKFSGKGHAAHICKQCAQLPPAAQSELMTINKLQNMMGHSHNKEEIKYLRNRLNDPRPAVKEAAHEAHHLLFPRCERSQLQKGLTVNLLEFYIRSDLWDEWGGEIHVHERFYMDNTGAIRRTLCDDGSEQQITVDVAEARKYLKSLIHQDGVLFWSEDLGDDDSPMDELIDILPEYWDLYEEDEEEPVDTREWREPIWSLHLKLSSGKECLR